MQAGGGGQLGPAAMTSQRPRAGGLHAESSGGREQQCTVPDVPQTTSPGDDIAQGRWQMTDGLLQEVLGGSDCADSEVAPANSSPAFWDTLRPRSPVQRCNPETAAQAQRALSGQPFIIGFEYAVLGMAATKIKSR